ncbi:DUF5684 domain-containing protein [Ruminococcus sp.]|uniref:DUF5684 domain-containing protein n=1 Tax=Ruminococcus sp. TaxID=41978 RepID=UPI0025F7A3D2|nr:DUF5684 domain-containing protein [Ruminococcus sp.]MCI6616387.1 DUF5684 domain-containing protein [Ruminococcus sp.]
MINALVNSLGVEFYVYLIQLAFFIIYLVSYWMLFKKANVPEWKSIIPFYNVYKMYDIVWETKYFWLSIGLTFVHAIFSYLIQNVFTTGILMIIFTVIRLIVLFFSCMVEYFFCRNLARSYGKGDGFTFGLFFLYPIFILILGLGSSRFVGKR